MKRVRRRHVLRAASVGVVIGFVTLAPLIDVGVASAVVPSAVAWWHRGPTDLAPSAPSVVDTPPTARPALVDVPKGGLYVENDASGPRAIAAVRFVGDAAPNVLTLHVAGQPFLPLGAHLVACPIASAWQTTDNGAWSSRPTLDCSTARDGSFADNRSTVHFDLGATEAYRTPRGVEIGITPAANEVVSFAIAFDSPGDVPLQTQEPASQPIGPTSLPRTDAAGTSSALPARSAAPQPPPAPPSNVTAQPTTSTERAATTIAVAPVVRIGTDGRVRAAMTLLVGLTAGALWLLSGRERTRPHALDGEVAA